MNKNLFDNIEINKFKWLFIWKYCFQLLIEPAIFSCAFSIFAFFSLTIIKLIGQDLFINLSFNYKIQVLANTTQAETEVFRIFKKGDLDSHFVIENE